MKNCGFELNEREMENVMSLLWLMLALMTPSMSVTSFILARAFHSALLFWNKKIDDILPKY